jgi:3-hydroxyethyl bacteriochlorophyllide a dehydrogenase
MHTLAVVLDAPQRIAISEVSLTPPGPDDVVVATEWSGISTGTEKLLWSGRMPPFPGMGYPLIPGYESVGRIVSASDSNAHRIGERVFVGGARCYENIHALFGGSSHRLIVAAEKAVRIDDALGEQGVLLALAATAHHALTLPHAHVPDLIVGHGVLGRLCARMAIALGGNAPTVWEQDPERQDGAAGYAVRSPEDDTRRDYQTILDVSGDHAILDRLTARLAPCGTIILAGFYDQALAFSFPQAFMREAQIRIAAEFKPDDVAAVLRLLGQGRLSLDGLITHREPASSAHAAYSTAFADRSCLKMILDWRTLQ